jgi:hypothetical protein
MRQVSALQFGTHCPSVHPMLEASDAVQQNSSTRQSKGLQLPPPPGVSVAVAVGAGSVGVGVGGLHAPSTHASPAPQQAPLQQAVAHAESLATGWQAPPLQALQTSQVVAEPAVHTPF